MSGGAPLPPSQMPLQKVHDVQFEVFKERQIKAYATCRIEHAKSYEHGQPVRGGINDLRMGTTDFDFSCETCGLKHPECPGHFGYIELAEPIFNINVFDVVLIALKCVCKYCGALLMDTNDPTEMKKIAHVQGINRLRLVAKLCGSVCKRSKDIQGCEGKGRQPRIGRFLGIYPGLQVKVTQEEQDYVWHADNARQVLDRVSDSDALIMGFDPRFCHPRDLILTVLPIPPPQVRPAVAFGSAKSDDELTHQIMSIVKRNIQLRKDKESGVKAAVDRSRALLQEHVATFFNNASTFYKPAKVGDTKKLKSLTERLKGKYGRLRGNLMGKRVDFSARTVITGDPNIDVDEVGVPFSVAMTLTFPERVNVINKKRLTEFVQRATYPSANYIIRPNGNVTKLALVKDRSSVNLDVGDVVERHVIDGDVVLFNRQPTLHRMSMMGHRVRVLNYNTFRLNLSCTTPYNADFDGDEMNLHVPQSLLTKAELIEMMMVPKNFVSPNKSAPCMGIVQDSLLGSYRLTDKDTFVDKYFIQSVALWLDLWELPVPAILKPRPLWTGKQIFSLILPEVNHPASPYDKPPFPHNDKKIMIQRGQLLVGAITKGVVGAAPGSLIHVIFNERGSDEVAKFINGVQRITTYFNYCFAFSVGVQDTVADASTLKEMNNVLHKTRQSVEKIGAAANNGKLTRKAGMSLLQSFEADVNSALNKCREEAAKKALSNVRRTNSFKVMIEAGSKGSDLNICQIAVFVGQQNVAGSRIPFGFRRRTLPHFMLDDYGETSRGMATRGYVEGLQPHEFYFHTMAGREGLIDTAVKTSDTGYLQRKLVKALEDVHAAYDGTVRNANQELVQLAYGEDGLDGARIEGNQTFSIPHMTNNELADKYRYEYNDEGSFSENMGGSYMDTFVRDSLLRDPQSVSKLHEEYNQLMKDRDMSRLIIDMEEKNKLKMNLPVNVARLIQNARTTMGKRSQVSNLNPITVIHRVRELQEDLVQLFPSYHKDYSGRFLNVLSQQRVERALTLFGIHLRQILGSKRVLKEYKLNDKAFEYLLKEIRTKYQQSLIAPGEIIGAIAAQSCGEPATQMTLNTFHNAGISSKNVTLGVPRLLELLNVSKNQRNASIAVCLTREYQQRQKAQEAQQYIEYCTLANITTTVQIIYDPDPLNTVVAEDVNILEWEQAVMNEDERLDAEQPSPFIARLILDTELFNDKRLNMKDVKSAIRQMDDSYLVQANLENDGHRVVRLRPRKCAGADSVPELTKAVAQLLQNVHLRGIPGIKKTLLKEGTTFSVDPATGGIVKESSWMVDTEGTALQRIFVGVVNHQGVNIVDFAKTSSNKIPEIATVLGIEAARRKLLFELREAYLAYGLNINYRHYTILVDTMCQRGYLMAVSRTGINRSETSGPLMRCSFEETVKVLMAAAAFGEKDPVRGVSANLVLGNQARIGTGLFDLMLDMSKLQHVVPLDKATEGRTSNVYHTEASVAPGSSMQGLHSDLPPSTVHENSSIGIGASSVYPRQGGGAGGVVGPYAGMAIEASQVLFSSVLHPSMGAALAASNTSDYHSSQHLSGASTYVASSNMASVSALDVDLSSYHLQSVAPTFHGGAGGGYGSLPGGMPMPGAPAIGGRGQPYPFEDSNGSLSGLAGALSGVANSRASAPYDPNQPSHDFSPTEEQEE
ncbi:RNA polymerase ii largest subunit (RPOIILS) [Leptomonas pyrrhocoris]|uniref:DNA-directed RNA polymerase subunit n=1 Tax=Leptomonas pyrrhocoris TaxID=157538 RepID=A0A0N1J4B0_LEPPY|nr:RNA polymerase ii largest subunit (RPOIILS) [Leptomonas pyrrhocoris]XP_015652917.1 RNA polymerase ii largest subunit (RPOIILS) [Leptomonas pyrrhocoris]KPA74477.1 RNA polymerase ii largest subunit (RPOIILS) [Leptomonas pyrrhocoris]KPA74478.1 RNA polymerase ii largest subunit (RPOIILS) [Leptomonas pyrrhocoris]|eukprot:XP_015652916.1 RNA polymerase ii largest subunit (RPOIILS) [Leptomonas pyrrhocoris]